MASVQPTAARNNAEWCRTVCLTHGIDSSLDDEAWTSRTRTPPLYPDAVTLVPRPGLPGVGGPAWEVVTDPAVFTEWERRWRGNAGPVDVLLGDLLSYDSVVVLVARAQDQVVAGAILNHDREIVGISNFFAEPSIASASWVGCVTFAGTLFPGSMLVGYASGGALDAARETGFETAGSLRVWIRDG